MHGSPAAPKRVLGVGGRKKKTGLKRGDTGDMWRKNFSHSSSSSSSSSPAAAPSAAAASARAANATAAPPAANANATVAAALGLAAVGGSQPPVMDPPTGLEHKAPPPAEDEDEVTDADFTGLSMARRRLVDGLGDPVEAEPETADDLLDTAKMSEQLWEAGRHHRSRSSMTAGKPDRRRDPSAGALPAAGARQSGAGAPAGAVCTPTTEARNVLSGLLDRARQCLPLVGRSTAPTAVQQLQTATQYLRHAVKSLEASAAAVGGVAAPSASPDQEQRDPSAGPSAADPRRRSSKRKSMESFDKIGTATRADIQMGSPLISSGRRVDDSTLHGPNASFIRKLPLAPIDKTVTTDYASPRMGARRLGGTPDISSRGRGRGGGLQLSASRRGMRGGEDVAMTPDPLAGTGPDSSLRREPSPHTAPSSVRKLNRDSGRLEDTAGRLRDETRRDSQVSSASSSAAPAPGKKAPAASEPDILRKITVKGGGVTTDYASPRVGSRRLGTRNLRGSAASSGSGAAGDGLVSSRAGAPAAEALVRTPQAEAPESEDAVAKAVAEAEAEARAHAQRSAAQRRMSAADMASPPASPRDVYSSVLLSSLAMNDLHENDRQAMQDRHERDRTPKPEFLRKLNMPAAGGGAEPPKTDVFLKPKADAAKKATPPPQPQPNLRRPASEWELPEQREIAALLERAEACCPHLSQMDPAVVQRVRVLLDLAAEQLERSVQQ